MIEHVSVRHEGACPQAADVEPKIAAAHAHARPLELLQRSHAAEWRVQFTYYRVVALYRLIALFDLESCGERRAVSHQIASAAASYVYTCRLLLVSVERIVVLRPPVPRLSRILEYAMTAHLQATTNARCRHATQYSHGQGCNC